MNSKFESSIVKFNNVIISLYSESILYFIMPSSEIINISSDSSRLYALKYFINFTLGNI